MRKKGYSTLGLLPDEEYISGLHTLEVALREGPIRAQLSGETIVWFVKDEVSEQDMPAP